MRTESTFLRIACKNEVGIILRFVGIPLRIGGTRSPEYSQNQDFFALLLDNDEKKRELMQVFLEDVYKHLRSD